MQQTHDVKQGATIKAEDLNQYKAAIDSLSGNGLKTINSGSIITVTDTVGNGYKKGEAVAIDCNMPVDDMLSNNGIFKTKDITDISSGRFGIALDVIDADGNGLVMLDGICYIKFDVTDATAGDYIYYDLDDEVFKKTTFWGNALILQIADGTDNERGGMCRLLPFESHKVSMNSDEQLEFIMQKISGQDDYEGVWLLDDVEVSSPQNYDILLSPKIGVSKASLFCINEISGMWIQVLDLATKSTAENPDISADLTVTATIIDESENPLTDELVIYDADFGIINTTDYERVEQIKYMTRGGSNPADVFSLFLPITTDGIAHALRLKFSGSAYADQYTSGYSVMVNCDNVSSEGVYLI